MLRVIWAPWRMSYIEKIAGKVSRCFFCEAAKNNDDKNNYVVYRSKYSIALLNIYPYNNAHVMVAPIRHVPSIELLTDEELLDLMKVVNIVLKAIRMEYKPDGFNLGLNIGRTAGAGIESHVHIHIVPRWAGDTNFMPVLAKTKVIPEDLEKTWERLKKAIQSISLTPV